MVQENQIMVSSSMSEKLAIRARIFAARRNISRAELIRQALEMIMEEDEEAKPSNGFAYIIDAAIG